MEYEQRGEKSIKHKAKTEDKDEVKVKGEVLDPVRI
jgi:hypothetical protein